MAQPLMPKATAVWLVENTALSFEQISEFCGLHELETQAIADGEVATGMVGMDPIANGQLTQEEIDRCVADPAARLKLAVHDMPMPQARTKGPRYTPVTKRQDKPDGISWLLKNHPELSDAAIGRLIGTTKPTINAVRDRSHWNSANIKAQSPVQLGLCSYQDLADALAKARKRAGITEEAVLDGSTATDTEVAPEPATDVDAGTDSPSDDDPAAAAHALFKASVQ